MGSVNVMNSHRSKKIHIGQKLKVYLLCLQSSFYAYVSPLGNILHIENLCIKLLDWYVVNVAHTSVIAHCCDIDWIICLDYWRPVQTVMGLHFC